MDSEDFMTKIHLQDLTHFFLGIVKQMWVLEHFVRPVLFWPVNGTLLSAGLCPLGGLWCDWHFAIATVAHVSNVYH